jgi:hypothetical protein
MLLAFIDFEKKACSFVRSSADAAGKLSIASGALAF